MAEREEKQKSSPANPIHPEQPGDSNPDEELADPRNLKRKREEAKKALRPELPSGDPSDSPQGH